MTPCVSRKDKLIAVLPARTPDRRSEPFVEQSWTSFGEHAWTPPSAAKNSTLALSRPLPLQLLSLTSSFAFTSSRGSKNGCRNDRKMEREDKRNCKCTARSYGCKLRLWIVVWTLIYRNSIVCNIAQQFLIRLALYSLLPRAPFHRAFPLYVSMLYVHLFSRSLIKKHIGESIDLSDPRSNINRSRLR